MQVLTAVGANEGDRSMKTTGGKTDGAGDGQKKAESSRRHKGHGLLLSNTWTSLQHLSDVCRQRYAQRYEFCLHLYTRTHE